MSRMSPDPEVQLRSEHLDPETYFNNFLSQKRSSNSVNLSAVFRGFAEIARPLHRLCGKGVHFEWTSECNDSFVPNTMMDAVSLAKRCEGMLGMCYGDRRKVRAAASTAKAVIR